ncbi:MAG: type II toxin-antitoxin system PemK/MazF family toxin [Balneolaceae bacterium]|nr:type II toxin-antitoxin system PemK/MazF family toxin [Balneolaceae bacterium]
MNKGDIVLVPFPFTDLSSKKRRPALVLLSGNLDVVLAFITTKLFYEEESSIVIDSSDETGLKKQSLIRLDKLVTLDKELVIGKLGEITDSKLSELNQKMIQLYRLI